MHTFFRQKEQLKLSKINFKKNVNLKWLYSCKRKTKKKIALIVPGGSKKRHYKRSSFRNFLKHNKIFDGQ